MFSLKSLFLLLVLGSFGLGSNEKEDLQPGEEYSTVEDAPWFVAVYDGARVCSGVLLDWNFVMTSASCLTWCTESYDFRFLPEEVKIFTEKIVKRIIFNAGFNCSMRLHNIALLELTKEISYLSGLPAEPAILIDDRKKAKKAFENVTAFGYNRLKHYGRLKSPLFMKKAGQKDLTFSDDTVDPNQILVHDRKNNKCFLHSVLAAYQDQKQFVVGIINIAQLECTKDYLYTRISPYLDWILKNRPKNSELQVYVVP